MNPTTDQQRAEQVARYIRAAWDRAPGSTAGTVITISLTEQELRSLEAVVSGAGEAAETEREACAQAAQWAPISQKYMVGNRPFLDTKEAIAQDEMRTAVALLIRSRGDRQKAGGL